MKQKQNVIKIKKNSLQDWVESILWAFVFAMIIRNYTFQNFKIPSSSMESTLLIGDYLVANKIKYFFKDPERDDIVTFRYPADPLEPEPRERYIKILAPVYWDKEKNFLTWYEKKNVVKRVIGLPGDVVEVKDKDVYINGELFKKDYEQYLDNRTIPREYSHIQWNSKLSQGQKEIIMGSRDNIGPIVVPEGKYFVLGDNRDYSADSRYWGLLDREDITGTPLIIFFSRSDDGENRWERSFKLIK
ncbi:MAG: signal peptidase I [Candidatus Cloacimonetes bacterium]|jgi:signal peptidase I|nr:signal peptidase I [Candidatus Cloacimonadota bacterium]MDD2650870.1 signal peptidase I [Candidatus Cloacimonadota bacterium]MDD3500843.1 signal peptidase I [Candidatus Cloacimonadota bacterium]